MTHRKLKHCLAICAFAFLTNVTSTYAQAIEIVGSRALGMGGAFVAVANDSSATWWNPGGLATGPFIDVAVATTMTEVSETLPGRRDSVGVFTLGMPAFGFSYYRLRLTVAEAPDPTVTESVSREDRGAGIPIRSVAANQFGATVVQTVLPGIHVGATLKYLSGTVRSTVGDSALPVDDLLEIGSDLEGGDSDSDFDADIGVMSVTGPLRIGVLVKNVFEPTLENEFGQARLNRQFRVGAAFDAAASGGAPFTAAVDVDLSTTEAVTGDRRNVAVGVEHWLMNRRLGLRGGARFNTTGEKERAATGGISAAIRAGFFVDAHVVVGGDEDEWGWGIATRVSF
jgi:hypothetical protein